MARRGRIHPVSGVPYALLRQRARAMRAEGIALAGIAEALGVTKPAVSHWVRDLPEHGEATARNTAAVYAGRRIYPEGTQAYVSKLARLGYGAADRLRLARQVAR